MRFSILIFNLRLQFRISKRISIEPIREKLSHMYILRKCALNLDSKI